MNIKKTIYASTLVFMTCGIGQMAMAQSAKTETTNVQSAEHKKGKEDMLKKMKEELNLTDDQAAKIKEIHKKYKAQKEVLGEDKASGDKKKALKKQEKEEVKKILTPEQIEKLEKLKAEHKAKHDKEK